MPELNARHWAARFEAAHRASVEAQRKRGIPDAEASLERAFELMALAEDAGHVAPTGVPEEDLRVYQLWARARSRYAKR